MVNLLDLSYQELEAFMADIGEARFRAAQVWQWIWQRNITDFQLMTNLSKDARAKLVGHACCRLPEIVDVQKSSDGTEKFLLRFYDGALVETVLIPSEGHDGNIRMAQCVSSQIGCPMKCTFCSTGTMGFIRNMTSGEILSQVLIAKRHINDNTPGKPILRNLVFMGMGEPLLNLREVTKALRVLHHPHGAAFTARRITVSTCGIKQGLAELGESGLAFLAVSLHAPNQTLRARIMPKAAAWDLSEMMDTLGTYPLKTRERVTFEYLLLGGVNDSTDHARELARLIHKTLGPERAKLNLIAYNPSLAPEGAPPPYAAPTPDAILAFEQTLWNKDITAILRKSKGQDIQAACGQLATAYSHEQGRP